MKKIGLLLLVSCLFVSGCFGSKDARVASLEGKTTEVEGRLETIEQRLTALEVYYQEMNKAKAANPAPAPVDTKVAIAAMTDADIQTALKNAGFYSGPVDGKIGPNTSNCIKEFQKANGLTADGVPGDKTKALLLMHLKPSGIPAQSEGSM